MNHDELEQLYRQYYNELYLYAFSMCKNHAAAQDIVSDTFFKALLSLKDGHTGVKYWLLYVCKNLVADYFRRQKRLAPLPEEDTLPAQEADMAKRLIDNEERAGLYKALLRLPQAYKEIIVLYYFSNLSVGEIAQLTGQSGGAVRTLLYRARNRLREYLKEE